ncbi:MAG: transposase [bacterium]
MARKPRIHLKGAVYHVMLRGNDGQQIFFDIADYNYFEKLVAEGIGRFQHRIHGYCWMPNHVHMIVEVNQIPLSKIMQNLSFRYTRWINKKQNRIGHLFQGRYKAILIDADTYLLELVRYIHLNPVRSGLIDRPDLYHWSGHRSYLGLNPVNWQTTDWILRRFNNHRPKAINEYQKFTTGHTDDETEKAFYYGNQKGMAILGDDTFMEKLPDSEEMNIRKGLVPLSIPEISEQVCNYFDILEEVIKQKQNSRLGARYRTYVAFIYSENKGSIKEVATYFKRDPSTLSRQLTTLKQKLLEDKVLQKEVADLEKYIYAFTQA